METPGGQRSLSVAISFVAGLELGRLCRWQTFLQGRVAPKKFRTFCTQTLTVRGCVKRLLLLGYGKARIRPRKPRGICKSVLCCTVYPLEGSNQELSELLAV